MAVCGPWVLGGQQPLQSPRGDKLPPVTKSVEAVGALDVARHFGQIWARRLPFGRRQNFAQILLFPSPTDLPSLPQLPSLRGYRRAETADGPRRRHSVLHMRAQMPWSLFLARCGSIHGRSSPVRCFPPPLVLKFVHFLLKNTLELGRIFRRIFCKFGPESGKCMKECWGASNRNSGRSPHPNP